MSNILKLTYLNGKEVYVSGVVTVCIGEFGVTEITTSSGLTMVVKESPSEVVEKMNSLHSLNNKSLRDEFAISALDGILSSQGIRDIKYIGELSYEIADIMLKERLK